MFRATFTSLIRVNNAVRLLEFVAPVPSAGALANAATNILGSVAPGESVTIYGTGIGPATLTQSTPDQLRKHSGAVGRYGRLFQRDSPRLSSIPGHNRSAQWFPMKSRPEPR